MIMKTALVIALLSAVAVDAACTCTKKTEQAGNCTLNFDVCGCFVHLFSFEYKASVTETHSGKSAAASWYKSGTGAAENAALALFHDKLGHQDCSCQGGVVPVGFCMVNIEVCFFFNSTGDLTGNRPSFKAWATEQSSGIAGYVIGPSDPTQAATDSIANLFAVHPDIRVKCIGALEHEAGPALLPAAGIKWDAPLEWSTSAGGDRADMTRY